MSRIGKKCLIGGMVGGIIGVVILIALLYQRVEVSAAPSFKVYATDVIGTKNGTTTTGAAFGTTIGTAHNASSSYITKINNIAETIVYTIFVKNASSSADMTFSVLSSNDDYCDTSTTTTVFDVVTKSQINWFDAGIFLDGHGAQTSLALGTTTISFDTSLVGSSRQIVLKDVAASCLKLEASGSSTEIWAQIRQK